MSGVSDVGTRMATAGASTQREQPANSCDTACGISNRSDSGLDEAGARPRGAFSVVAILVELRELSRTVLR